MGVLNVQPTHWDGNNHLWALQAVEIAYQPFRWQGQKGRQRYVPSWCVACGAIRNDPLVAQIGWRWQQRLQSHSMQAGHSPQALFGPRRQGAREGRARHDWHKQNADVQFLHFFNLVMLLGVKMRKRVALFLVALWVLWIAGNAIAYAMPINAARFLAGAVAVLFVVGGGVVLSLVVYAVLTIAPAIAARIGAARGVNVAYDPEEGVVGVGTVVLPRGEPSPRAASVLAAKALARRGIIDGVACEEESDSTPLPPPQRLFLP